jgi:hypothetical protein
MNKSNYDVRRPMFWLVTLMAVTVIGHSLLIFVRSGFVHPVRIVGNLIALTAIWSIYFGIVRDLRAANGGIADKLPIRVETSVGLCCLLGYLLAMAAD